MRKEARETAFKLVFLSEFNNEADVELSFMSASEGCVLSEEDKTFANNIYELYLQHKEEIKQKLEQQIRDYELARVYKIDLALLEVAITEIEYIKTPAKIVINEILELAKVYSTENSVKFINGVLASLLKEWYMEAISVSKLCFYIKNIFDNEELLHNISIYGEISNYSELRGNAYFNLKDKDAMISCVYFGALESLKNGDKIIAVGTPSYYTKGGKLNFNVLKTAPFGVGELYKNFLELKEKLQTEGLFDEKYKKPIPQNIKRIGVVTSDTGAVIHDIINVVTRRNNSIDIVLYPSKVQGDGADNEIIAGIKFFENYDVDAIVVARGGGSFEDLNVFNSEKLARAVFDCDKFIMSAVGHETDFTIIDFVSDLRAPTPSIAAELLSTLKQDKKSKIVDLFSRINLLVEKKIQNEIDKQSEYVDFISSTVASCLRETEYDLAILCKNLEKHNVGNILKKGFSYLLKDGKSVDLQSIDVGDNVEVVTKDGIMENKVLKIKRG